MEVTLVEREPSFGRVFRGEGLMPAGVDALLQMGLGQVLLAIPSRRVESWHIWIDGREAFTIPEPLAQLGDRAMRVVSQPALLEKVVEEAGRSPSFRYAPGARVRGLLRAADRVAGVRVETASGTREGNPLSPEEQWRRFQWLLEWAGIPPNPCHSRRHTAAHLMLTQGIPLEVAQAILGHASIQITVASYGHVQPAAQAQAVQSRRTALVGRPRKPPKVSPKVSTKVA